jgi:hypothetical protein
MTPTHTSKPLKGRITLLESPDRIDLKEFIWNPTTVNDTKTVNWGTANVAGASHPVYQFGSGGERVISMELQFDAIRSGLYNGQGLLDLTEELRWYRSLTYPTAYATAFSKVSPPRISFSFGTMWDGVICVVKKADPRVLMFSEKLLPLRATVSLEMVEVVTKSQIYSDVYKSDSYNGIPSPPVGPSTTI